MTKHTDDTTDAAIESVSHQPQLPALELPEYHGRKASKMKTALTGAGSRVTRPHSIGDRVILVIEARVKSAGHEDTDDGLEYVEKLKVLDLFELSGEQGQRLVSTVRSLYRTGEDALKGRTPVPELGDVGYTDGSGVVLTPKEVAELRGDPIRAILTPELTPVVVVYSDGARELWPDQFPKDAPRPTVGEVFVADGADVTVVKLLDNITGEELEVLTVAEDIAAAASFGAAPPDPIADRAAEVEALADAGLDQQPTPLDDLAARGFRVEAPRLPGEDDDPYSGDLGDTADGWDTPDPATAAGIAADDQQPADESDRLLPTSADFALVDCEVDQLRPMLGRQTNIDDVRRLRKAEEQGRGRGLKPRKGALFAIDRRITELEDAVHQANRAAQMEGGA